MNSNIEDFLGDLGVSDKRQSNMKFLAIKHGGITEEGKEGQKGFVKTRVEKKDKTFMTKYIKTYGDVVGFVDGIEHYKRKQEVEGKTLKFEGFKLRLDTGKEIIILDISLKSRAGSKFLNTAMSVDYEKPLMFAAWTDAKGLQFTMKQRDPATAECAALKYYYKKDDMKDCPEPVWVEGRDDEGSWNWDKTIDYQIAEIKEKIVPVIAQFKEERKEMMDAFRQRIREEAKNESEEHTIQEDDEFGERGHSMMDDDFGEKPDNVDLHNQQLEREQAERREAEAKEDTDFWNEVDDSKPEAKVAAPVAVKVAPPAVRVPGVKTVSPLKKTLADNPKNDIPNDKPKTGPIGDDDIPF